MLYPTELRGRRRATILADYRQQFIADHGPAPAPESGRNFLSGSDRAQQPLQFAPGAQQRRVDAQLFGAPADAFFHLVELPTLIAGQRQRPRQRQPGPSGVC